MRGRITRQAGAAVYLLIGIGLATATLIVEGLSWSVLFSGVLGISVIAIGIWQGVPRVRNEMKGTAVPVRTRATVAVALSAAGGLLALALCVALAYLLGRLGDAADFALDLQAVALMVAAAAFIYAAILQWVSAGGRRSV